MDLTRTRRALATNPTEDYQHATQLLDALDIVQEDAQESLEDQMRLHQQSISKDDVSQFVERSVEYLFKQIMEVSDTETLLRLLINKDKKGFEATMSKLRSEIDEKKADKERWAYIGEELGDLDDHPF